MNGVERREKILKLLKESDQAIAGKDFSQMLGVSRQVIVQDIALLRAQNYQIVSTNLGYVLNDTQKQVRVFKVKHTDAQTEEELNLIVDYGATVEDVFVYHHMYGEVRAKMNISSRNDVQMFLDGLKTGKSTLLKNVTSDYHYHTVSAPSNRLLDLIQEELEQRGFLAKLQDYEPVNFWDEK